MPRPVDPRSVSRAAQRGKQPQHGSQIEGGYGQGAVSSYGNQTPAWDSGNFGGQRQQLSRAAEVFANALMAPGVPIETAGINETNDEGLVEPRRYQFPVSWNMPHGDPGSEGYYKLASFDNLRAISDIYSVAAACLDLRISEIRNLGWDIVPSKEAAAAMKGSKDLHKDFQERRAKAVRFFKRPDRKYGDYSSWLCALLYDVFQVDALSVYLHPSKVKGKGLLGSNLGQLALLDGTTIRPMIDVRGDKPIYPNVAYQQYLYGVPRADMTAPPDEEELADRELVAEYRSNQLLYLPYVPRNWTPYGWPPVERALIPILTGINRQHMQLDYFTEGTIPGMFVTVGDANMGAGQLRNFQDALNAVAGDLGHKHRIVALPAGSHVDLQKQNTLADQFDEILMSQVTMAFGVMPIELGISPRVSATQDMRSSKQMVSAANDIANRKALKPLLMWLKASLFDYVLQVICGQSDMEWMWEGVDQGLDEATQVSILIQKQDSGLATIDENRGILGEQPYGLPMTSEPVVKTNSGYLALGSIDPTTGMPVGLQPNAEQAAADPGDDGGSGDAGKPPAKKPKPDGSQRGDSPGNAGARAGADESDRQVGSKPGAGGGKDDKTKAALAELDGLRRRLKQGKPIDDWVCRSIDQGVLDSMLYALKMGEPPVEVIDKARQAVFQSHLERRDQSLRSIKETVASGLGKTVEGLRTGRIAGPFFITEALSIMTEGTRQSMKLGAAHALSDLGHPGHRIAKQEGDELDYDLFLDDTETYWDNQADDTAEAGRHYLERLMRDAIALGGAAGALGAMSARFKLYGQQATSAYEQAYGVTSVAASYVEADANGDPPIYLDDGTEVAPGEQLITWQGGDCGLCASRDGDTFTIETLPGWPGDGFFGELCDGGPNCNCSLDYETVTYENGIKLGGYAAERASLAADQRQRMQQVNDLRLSFIRSLPQAVQARAAEREAARRALADEMGAHRGHTVWPEDVASSDVRDRVGAQR